MKVLMVCSGGMSSTIVVKAIEKEAKKQDFSIEISAVGTTQLREEMEKTNYDLLLVAPQVKHRLDNFKEIASKHSVPVELIPPMGYTPIGAPKVLNDIIKKHSK